MHLAGRGGRMQLASYEVQPAVVVASYLEWNISFGHSPNGCWGAQQWGISREGNPRILQTASLLLMYLPNRKDCTSSKIGAVFWSWKTAWSLPLLMYLHMYFMDFTEWHHSPLMWAWNILDRTGLYGTIHLFSTGIYRLCVLYCLRDNRWHQSVVPGRSGTVDRTGVLLTGTVVKLRDCKSG